MAGEIEEPISFQVDSIHSGSISFGRFETESLSWERRSSFSHNRYLEEVEKCSTPGSVTQKKAYFEAHFKKKALLRASSECENGMEYQTNDSEILDHMSYMEECEHATEGSHFADYDESSHGSEYLGECDAMGFEREGQGISSSEFQVESALNNADAVLEDLQHIEPNEMHQTQFGCNAQSLLKNEPEIEVKHKLADEAENMDGVPKSTSPSPKSHTAENGDNTSLTKSQNPELKVKVIAETEVAKPKLREQVPRNISSEVPKVSAKNPRRMERQTPLRTKIEKGSSQKTSPTTPLMRTLKVEDPENLKARLNQDKRSEIDPRAKKASAKPQPSAFEKDEPKACQSTTRPKRTVKLNKSDVKPSSVVFNFKSDERAEKRKEFFMKLEEKMHAKEVELNQIQARTQEETEAEIKQFRRSLNFKATPMPSFYHETVPQGSDGKKAVSSHVRSTNLRSKSTSLGSTAAGRSPAFSRAGNQQGPSASQSTNATAQPQTSEETDCPTTLYSEDGCSSSIASSNRNHAPQARKRIELAGKKEVGKGKGSSIQKQRESQWGRAKKDRVERRQVVGVGRNSGEVVRKVMKGVSRGMGVGGGSRMGHVAVNVAS